MSPYAMISGMIVAVLGVLASQHILSTELAAALGTVASAAVAHLAHNAPQPAK